MGFTKSPLFRFALVLTLLAIPIAAFADKEAIGKPSGGGSAIDWQVKASGYDTIELTVISPSGDTYVRSFPAGRHPSFRLLDLGTEVEDGQYNYQLRLVPKFSNDVKQKLAQARAANDDKAARKALKDAGISDVSQSGSITVLRGVFVSPTATESDAKGAVNPRPIESDAATATQAKPRMDPVALDQVIPDDLIVQSSTCTGFDCVNGESFGFDTLRLKENNLRIHFDDTSASAGFPANDWRIVANDSASGGQNKLSIEDSTAARDLLVVEAAAPANSIYLDSTGRIGFRTTTPVLDLHVSTSNTPALRFEQTNAGGFTAQTWDVAGNEANFFVRDVTGGSRLPFRIRPGAPTSSIDISAAGNVGIGTASPARLLHLSASSGNAAIQFTNSSLKSWHIANSGNDLNVSETGIADARIYLQAGGNVGIACSTPAAKFVVASGGACSTPSSSLNPGDAQFTVASSRTFKENLSPVAVPDVLDRISKVGVYHYDFINGPKDRLGLIAEDFHEVLGRGDEKYISGGDVQVALWLAVQQLTAQNKVLTERLNALDKELSSQQNH
jgi:hypothetical protein